MRKGDRHGLLSLRVAVGLALLVLLAACFKANTPSGSTQTGNPPFIERKLVGLVMTTDGAKVVGKAGAVPSGASVEVINLRTGDVSRARAAEDGSFEVPVESEPNDTFSVTARKGDQVSKPVYVALGQATASDKPAEQKPSMCTQGECSALIDAGVPARSTCIETQFGADQSQSQAFRTADRGCSSDEECVLPPDNKPTCLPDCNYPLAYSRSGREELALALSDVEADYCTGYEAMQCTESLVQCDPIDGDYSDDVACVAGQCERMPKVWPSPADCVMCVEYEVRWSYMTGIQQNQDASRLSPCAHYARIREGGGFDPTVRLTCAGELAACDGAVSTQAVVEALAHADVVAVLESEQVEIRFGYMRGRNLNEPPNPVEVGVQVTLGREPEGKFLMIYGSCEGGPADCVPPPAGVAALRDLLLALDLAQEAGPCAEFSE